MDSEFLVNYSIYSFVMVNPAKSHHFAAGAPMQYAIIVMLMSKFDPWTIGRLPLCVF